MNAQSSESNTSSASKRWARRIGIVLLAVSGAILIYYGLYFILNGSPPPERQIIAHRGGPVYAPENTLAAFRNAVVEGADWLEFDVQRTQDGELVVIHDTTVDRTTNGSGKVGEMTFAEIRALDAGEGEQVPTFAEVLALGKEAGVGLLPEAKSPLLYPGIEADMLKVISESGYGERTVIQSFNPDTLARFLALDPDTQVCRLYGLWDMDLSDPQPPEAKFLCPMAEMILLKPWMIRQAHAQGREVFVWFGVIESPLTMRLMLAMGADGLMVNDPVALAEMLGRKP